MLVSLKFLFLLLNYLIAGLKSIKENWDDLDENICDAYDEVVYQLSVFTKEAEYFV